MAVPQAAASAATEGGSPGVRVGADAPERASAANNSGLWSWPSYGRSAYHNFHGKTSLTEPSAATLARAWSFPTGDAVTATPTIANGTVYAGSWDGYFYAIDLRTGALRWKYKLKPQPAVTPYPGEVPRDIESDGGLVTSSAWFQPGRAGHPSLVLFGGGYTLYALDADTGALYWSRDLTGRPELPADPLHDYTRIFSSPTVADGRVIVGVSDDGERDHRGYISATNLWTGTASWTFETDVDVAGKVLNDGCGGVWSSGTLVPRADLILFGTADCHFANTAPYSESVLALRPRTGQLVWQLRPRRADDHCDIDFGASVNTSARYLGGSLFAGIGGKDGAYYAFDPLTGRIRWSTKVVFGGSAGGFIATTAYDGTRVYGSTALGDVDGGCDPGNPDDTTIQDPSVHALDASTGAVDWEQSKEQSFGPTTVAGGMTFNCPALSPVVQIRDARTGTLVNQLPLAASCWSGVATVGDAIVFGTGSDYQGSPDGVSLYTPGGVLPSPVDDASAPEGGSS